ncbi:MAG: ABC transporter permease subunit [Phycisphaerae bacterium]
MIPANPILVRVVHGGSRRVRHLWMRIGYLGVLLFVVLVTMVADVGGSVSTLADLAKGASTVFMWASITQLSLMCFLAPVFTAGAITQERDAQTFNILLATPLSNAQIVLGSLMSRLYFLLVLLLAGLPIFLLTMVYGGVTLAQIIQSFAIAGATAVLTGSLAICISMIRVGTQRTIFSFYLMIGLYLAAVYALGKWDVTWIAQAPANVDGERLSWLAAFHPFLALDVALNRIPAPETAMLGDHGAITLYFLAFPHRAYVVLTLLLSLMLTGVAALFVRRPKETQGGLWQSLANRVLHRGGDERRRKPRHVWNNPVAWREATTRASASVRGFLQIALIGGGLLTAILLLLTHIDSGDAAITRKWLSVVLMVELGLILLAATNTAATSMTREKESQTLELLLATPLTSRYVVWGKLRGLITFTFPLVAVPTFTVLVLGLHGVFTGADDPVVPIEAALETAGLLLAYAAAACMLGLHVSLHSKKTVQSVMVSIGLLVVGCLIVTFVCDSIVTSAGVVGAAIAPITPFTGVETLVNPVRLFDGSAQKLAAQFGAVRKWSAAGSGITVGIYLLTVGWFYKSMVRNFDMTLRRQSAQL